MVIQIDDKMWGALQAESVDEKERALNTLGYASGQYLIAQTLNFAVGPAVRAQDTPSLIATVAAQGGESLQQAWDMLKTQVPSPPHRWMLGCLCV